MIEATQSVTRQKLKVWELRSRARLFETDELLWTVPKFRVNHVLEERSARRDKNQSLSFHLSDGRKKTLPGRESARYASLKSSDSPDLPLSFDEFALLPHIVEATQSVTCKNMKIRELRDKGQLFEADELLWTAPKYEGTMPTHFYGFSAGAPIPGSAAVVPNNDRLNTLIANVSESIASGNQSGSPPRPESPTTLPGIASVTIAPKIGIALHVMHYHTVQAVISASGSSRKVARVRTKRLRAIAPSVLISFSFLLHSKNVSLIVTCSQHILTRPYQRAMNALTNGRGFIDLTNRTRSWGVSHTKNDQHSKRESKE